MAALLGGEDPRGADLAVYAVRVHHAGIDGGALDHRALRGEIAPGKRHRAGEPALAGPRGGHDHVVRIHAVGGLQALAQRAPALGPLPPVEAPGQRLAADGEAALVEKPGAAQMQHHLGDAAGQEHAHRRVIARPVGQHVDQARHAAVDVRPVLDGGPAETRRMRDGGEMQEQIRRAAHRRVHHHGVPDGGVGDDVAGADSARLERHQRARRAPGHVEPERLARGRQRRVRQREAQRLADHLRGGGGAEELAAAAGGAAGAAAEVLRLLQRQLAMREARADGLHGARVLAALGWQRDAARHQHAGEIAKRGQRHHHGGQALVAGGHSEHALAGGERAGEATQHDGGVVPVGEAIHHAGGALGAAVAGIGAEAREGDGAQLLQLRRRGLEEKADLPVAGVIAQRDRGAVGGADAALGGEHEVLRAPQLARIPAHARVLGEAEDVAAGPFEEHLGGEGQLPRRTRPRRAHLPRALPASFLRRSPAHDLVEADAACRRGHGVSYFPERRRLMRFSITWVTAEKSSLPQPLSSASS